MIFKDRIDAGQQLADKLVAYKENAIIVAIPRGGVVVAHEIAKKLKVEIDIIIPRKIGAPGNPELAIGAIAGEEGVLLNHKLIQDIGVPNEYLEKTIAEERKELRRRESLYRQGLEKHSFKGKNCILVDDGLATGFTARAAVIELRLAVPAEIVLAVPVAPKQTIKKIAPEVDDVITVSTPDIFYAIGQFYENFTQVTDQEVISLISRSGN